MTAYTDRLAAARQAVAALHNAPWPTNLVDQVQAAANDAHGLYKQMADVLTKDRPGLGWQPHTPADAAEQAEAVARLSAALADCRPCSHLRKRPVQPSVGALPLRLIRCTRCTATHVRPPAGEDDRCDICGGREISTFHPFAVQMGPTIVVGDACVTCAAGLGVGGAS